MPPATALGYLYRTATGTALAGEPDGDLLRRFAAGSGAAEVAFAALLKRHGPAVLGVCRNALPDPRDAEDAFQATFLLLATRARSLSPRGRLGAWLCEVARRVCAHARAADARRRRHERRCATSEAREPARVEPDLTAVVRSALARLPEQFRLPVVLCDLQGLRYQEAAGQLGWTHAAVRSRLARGRRRMRDLLGRAGLAPAVTVAVVPRSLEAATVRTAALVAAGAADGAVPATILELMNGGLIVSKLKSFCLSAVAATVLVAGAVGLSAQGPGPTAGGGADDPFAFTGQADPTTGTMRGAPAKAGDPGDRMAKLLQETREKQAAGDVEGAMRALRQLDDASWAWQGALRQRRVGAGVNSDAGLHGSVIGRAADPLVTGGSMTITGSGTLSRPGGTAATLAPSGTTTLVPTVGMSTLSGATNRGPATTGGSVEARLREVEQKLDRLIKVLEGQKPAGPGQ